MLNLTTDWSFAPYRPLMFHSGDIYICRVAPSEDSVHFEWLDIGESYTVSVGVRGSGEYTVETGITTSEYTKTGLTPETDYEFFVMGEISGKKSRVRLARTGKSVGTVVNYLHPEDDVYSFSGRCLCSPSFVRHPDGYLIASMDVYAGQAPQNLTLLFRSDDDGETWHYVSELFPCFWGKMFVHKGDLYMLACSTEYGDLLIGRSTDGGKTFPQPTVLLRGSCSPKCPGVHRNPEPVVAYKGRIWNTLEWGAWAAGFHAPMVMSADENADLLDVKSWIITDPVPYDPTWPGVAEGPSTGVIEGALAIAPDGKFYNIMRYDTRKAVPSYGLALAFEVDADDPTKPLRYSHAVKLDGNLSKFMIKKDPVSGYYYMILSRITEPDKVNARNLLSLERSKDLVSWELVTDLLDYRHEPHTDVGFQYVDFEIEGDDIIYLCRTAINKARNFHDSNYSTFHRIKNFREL